MSERIVELSVNQCRTFNLTKGVFSRKNILTVVSDESDFVIKLTDRRRLFASVLFSI